MENIRHKLERIIAKVDCGNRKGNAFLIDECHAVTVKHCVYEAYTNHKEIRLIFPKLLDDDVIEVCAVIDEIFDKDEDELVLLILNRKLSATYIPMGDYKLIPNDIAEVFGYDIKYPSDGRWTQLCSAKSIIHNKRLVQDMLFDAINNRQEDYSGLSGSPIIKNEYIIGIISQETLENRQAVGIHGISIHSNKDFLAKYNIPMMEILENRKHDFEGVLTTGGYTKRSDIHIAGEQEYHNIICGKYEDILREIKNLHKRGDVDNAWEKLKRQIAELNSKDAIPDNIKAEYYMVLAIWFIEDKRDLGKAQKKYERAKKLNPLLQDNIYLALRKSVSDDNTNAEELINPINSVSEFNVYLQICLNLQRYKKAFEKYDEIFGTIDENSTTYYLLSIMSVLIKDYNNAMQYISEAIHLDRNVPFYYMMKGIIKYWKAIPNDVTLGDDIYPVLFCNGILHLDNKQLQLISEAGEEYRNAYNLAININNNEQLEVILNIWVNTFSINNYFSNDILEPIRLLKKQDFLSIPALLYRMYNKMELDDDVTIDRLERRLKSNANKVGYLLVLVEFAIMKNDKQRAKQYLHEYKSILNKGEYISYWYEYIVKVEEDKNKLENYEKELRENESIEKFQKKRLLALFIQLDKEREEQLDKLLVDIYSHTNKRLDLLNLIHFYRINRIWLKLKNYSAQLLDLFGDLYGVIYQVQALIGIGEYKDALLLMEDFEFLQDPDIKLEFASLKMVIMERMGQYSDAIRFGKVILENNITDQILIRLSNLYAMDGDEERALNILLKAEDSNCLTIEICQRISGFYITISKKKAWEYAKQALKLSEHKPEVMIWAMNIAYRTGRSDQTGEILHKLMTNYPNQQFMQVKSFEQVVEILSASKGDMQNNYELLINGKLDSHIFVDLYKGTYTYAEYFYLQWNLKEMLPLEFGAHYYRDELLDLKIKKIALDYSSCIILHEIGLLKVLGDCMEHVYIPGELFGIISEELRLIPKPQQEFTINRYKILSFCRDDLKVGIVETKSPRDLELIDMAEQMNAIYAYTAELNNAVWVSDREHDFAIRTIEVITALYRENKLSKDTYKNYNVDLNLLRDDKVNYLLDEHPSLLVDYIVLEKWYEEDLIRVINESFPLRIMENAVDSIEQEYNHLQQKNYICEQVNEVKNSLLELKEQEKLSLLPIVKQSEDLKYSNMVISLLSGAEKRELPICVDDRFLTSYCNVGEAPIYNVFDIMKILLLSNNITLEKYCELNKNLYSANIRYVLPDNRYILYAIQLSEYDVENYFLKESELLTNIRKYLVEAFSEKSYLSHNVVEHVRIPEYEYFLYHLQGQSRELIQSIWNSNMDNIKKTIASQWILFHFSQFAFDFGFDSNIQEKERIRNQSIQLADFIFFGITLLIEEKKENYYKWLYNWIDIYLNKNLDIMNKTLYYTKEFIVDFLDQCKNSNNYSKDEIAIFYNLIATGVHYMPADYKKIILKDKQISDIYFQIFMDYIILSNEVSIPAKTFHIWKREVLGLRKKEIIEKIFQNTCYELSWEYMLPALPRLIIKCKSEIDCKTYSVRLKLGERLQHKLKNVRKDEFRSLDNFLTGNDISASLYLPLMAQKAYENVADSIVRQLEISKKYEILRIKTGLLNNWMSNKNTAYIMIPSYPDYFKLFYDWKRDNINFRNIDEQNLVALPIFLNNKIHYIDCKNHNPVRYLHLLEQYLLDTKSSNKIANLIIGLFSYVDGDKAIYGELFILFLKYAWRLFSEYECYKNEPRENLIIWSYIWADEAMTCINKLSIKGKISIESYIEKFKKNTSIDITQDNFFDSMAQEDVLSPVHMNLFKLCLTGTISLSIQEREKISESAEIIFNYIQGALKTWLNIGVYMREAELTHSNDKNIFKSIFVGNFFSMLNKLISSSNVDINNNQELSIEYRIHLRLQNILDSDGIGNSELFYLFLLCRENMNEYCIKTIESIIQKQIQNKEIIIDIKRYRFLTYIITELSADFRSRFLEFEYDRLNILLCANTNEWESLYNILIEISQIDDIEKLIVFWEKYESNMTRMIDLRLVENIRWLQLNLPFKYSERMRNLIIRLELKA